MILISSPVIGSNILDLIVATNTSISNNTCGAIDVLTKQDAPTSTFNTTLDADKNDGIIIEGNTCRLIYNGFSNGLYFNGSTNASFLIQNGFGIFTGAIYINKNTCSFISVISRTTSTVKAQHPPVIISENRFIAYNIAFYTPYFNNVAQTTFTALVAATLLGT